MNTKQKGYIVRNGVVIGLNEDITLISSTPIGVVLPFAGSGAPSGYLICDGQEISRTEYPELYKVIGTTYGEGDGSTTFNVPNLIDKFIQGSTVSGTEKEAGLPNIEGSISNDASGGSNDQFLTDSTSSTITTAGALAVTTYRTRTSMGNGTESYNSPSGFDFDASRSNTIYGNSETVQPPALTMRYIIKAYSTNEGEDVGLTDEVKNYIDTTATIPTSKPATIEPGSIWIEA